MTQKNLFGDNTINQKNPLTNRRIGFLGKFKNRSILIKKIKEYGASEKSKEGITRDTQILVMGSDIKRDDLNRLTCYEHDGWKFLKISENDLHKIFNGNYANYYTPETPIKQVSIDMNYYHWTPPVISDDGGDEDNVGVRCSSPLVYGEKNPIYGMEIYVPNRTDANMNVIRQLIGNFGGYANTEYFDDTNVIMLGDSTLKKLEQGIKDEVILNIENSYNKSNTRMFNIQFTSERDFITWVEERMEKYPDESTLALLKKYTNKTKVNSQDVLKNDSCYQEFNSGEVSIAEKKQPAKKNINPIDFVTIDFERLDDSQLSVCEVGLVEYKRGEEISLFHSYINPAVGLQRNNWAKKELCHITDDMLLEAPSYEKLFPKLQEKLKGKILVSHSKGADLNYIYNLEGYYNLPKLYSKWIDTKEIAHSLKKPENLADLYRHLFGKPLVNHHKALDDARACGEILNFLNNKVNIYSFIHSEEYLPRDKKNGCGGLNTRHTQYGTANVEPDGLVFNHDKILDVNFFRGKTIVLSGMSVSENKKIKDILYDIGAKCPSSLSGKTNVFIINQNEVGPKKRLDAIRLQQTNGLLVISDEFFWKLLQKQ